MAVLFPQYAGLNHFIRQCANLWKVKELFFTYLTRERDKFFQIIDNMSIKVYKFARVHHTKLFKDSAFYGKWWSHTFLGYRLHLKINSMGMIQKCIVAPAYTHDIRLMQDLFEEDSHSWVFADKDYRSQALHNNL